MKCFGLIFVFAFASQALWGQAARLPKEKIPQSILDQIRLIQADFVTALGRDCADQGCFPRGCVHAGHEVVTLQGDQVLPGLATEGKARVSSEPQYLLTAVTCEFAYEEGLPNLDVESLGKRISTKLSSGILRVSVRPIAMPKGFEASNPRSAADLRHQLGQAMIQHFFWILLFVLTLATGLIGLWSWRRLGRDSKEDELRHMMLKRKLEREETDSKKEEPTATRMPSEEELLQGRLESLREPLNAHKDLVAHTCVQWLEREDFATLASCLLLVSAMAPIQLPVGPEHVLLQEKFQQFAQGFQPTLEQRRQLVDKLEKLLALQSQIGSSKSKDLQRFFRYFSARDLGRIMEAQSLEAQCCLLAIMPFVLLKDVIASLGDKTVHTMAQNFWQQDRVSLLGIQRWEEASTLAFEGKSIQVVVDRAIGPSLPVDAALLLSLLLVRLTQSERQQLESLGKRPWTKTVFYPELLRALSIDAARDVLLSCDGQALAHWFSILNSSDQALVWNILPQSYQTQLRVSMPEQADAQLVLDVIRTCGKSLYRRSWQGEQGREQTA